MWRTLRRKGFPKTTCLTQRDLPCEIFWKESLNAMKPLIVAVCFVSASFGLGAQTPAWQPSPGHTQVPIWPGAGAGAQPVAGPEISTSREKDHLVAGKPWTYVERVSRPTMTVYSPAGKNTGAAVVVFPGGGYQILAIDLEGTEVCAWLISKGITCVLLKYRVPGLELYPKSAPYLKSGPYPESPMALEDAQRTVGLVRFHAAEWHIDPHKIGGAWVFCRAGTCRQRSVRTLKSVCIRLSTPPTKRVAARILPWLSIPGICRLLGRSGMPGKAPESLWFIIRRLPIKIWG